MVQMRKTYYKVSRRQFMRRVGAASIAAAGAAATQMLAASTKAAARPVQYGMLIDTRKCVGCHACSIACRSQNDVPEGHDRAWVEYTEKGSYPNVSLKFLPRLCNQCSEPQCVSVCPTGATWKREEDGVVVVDETICIGCKYCIQACPYDARFLNPKTGAADKCDFCSERVAQGLEPACVATCFFRARIFGDLNDPGSDIARLIASNPVTVLRQEMGTRPNVYYIAADHVGEHDARYAGQYIRVTTHRISRERR